MSAFARPMLLALAVAHAAAVSGRASIFEVAPLRLVGDSAQPDAPITFVMANFGMVPYGSSVECAASAPERLTARVVQPSARPESSRDSAQLMR